MSQLAVEENVIDKDEIGKKRELLCINNELVQKLFQRALLEAEEYAKKSALEIKRVVVVNIALAGFFDIVNRHYPGRFVNPKDLHAALGPEERTLRASALIGRARATLEARGRTLYNLFGVGYKVATPSETIEEFLKKCARGAAHLGSLKKQIDAVNITSEEYKEIDDVDKELLVLAHDLCSDGEEFLRSMGEHESGLSEAASNELSKVKSLAKAPIFTSDRHSNA